MASTHSFNIGGKVDLHELDNAINQAKKEVGNRYDLKNAFFEISFSEKDKQLTLETEDDYKLRAIKDIFHQKLIKRGISLKSLDYSEPEENANKIKQKAAIQSGIPKEKAKNIVKAIKDMKIKAQAQIENDEIRVSSKSINDLQAVIAGLKAKDFDCHLAFTNYR